MPGSTVSALLLTIASGKKGQVQEEQEGQEGQKEEEGEVQ